MDRISTRAEFIEKQKKITSTIMKQKSGLIIKKARELSILCGVDACMIINAPKENKNNDEPVDLIWSSSSDSGVTVQKLVKIYKEASAEDRRKRVYTVSNYFVDKIKKKENMLASLKKKNCEASKLSTWNPKFESMKEHELRELANGLEIKIDNLKSRRGLMKNKRIKTGIDGSHIPSPQFVDFQPIFTMEPNCPIPMAMNSLHCNSNYNCKRIVRNQMNMAMSSIGDENNHNYQANSLENRNNSYVQSRGMIQGDVAHPMVLPMFDHHACMDSQPPFFYGPKRFVNYNSGARIEAKAISSSSSSSFLMNPAMMSNDLPESFVYRNSRMENSVMRQSFYDPQLPPMPDQLTNEHVSSHMQYSEQSGLLYNSQ